MKIEGQTSLQSPSKGHCRGGRTASRLWTVKEIEKVTGYSESKIKRAIQRGELRRFKTGVQHADALCGEGGSRHQEPLDAGVS